MITKVEVSQKTMSRPDIVVGVKLICAAKMFSEDVIGLVGEMFSTQL